MPAVEPIPSLQGLVDAYAGGLTARRSYGDTHVGSIHDHCAAAGAVMWHRQMERDRDEWRQLYFNTASGTRLEEYIEFRFPGKALILAQKGTGQVRLSRPNTTKGAGTFLAKTRIAVSGSNGGSYTYYEIDQDTPCTATTLQTPWIPVTAQKPGPESKIQVRRGDRPVLRVEDALWDNSWLVDELACEAGTKREDDDVARARIKSELTEERLGFEPAITKRLKQAGADVVVFFRSDYLGVENDHGLNRIYVGDANFETSAVLLRDCRLAMPDVGIAGMGIQTLPMTTYWLDLNVAITFWDAPEKFAMDEARENARAAVVEYFESRENPFIWDINGVRGAVRRAVEDTQSIGVTASAAPPVASSLFDTVPLRRFRTTPNRVNVSLA